MTNEQKYNSFIGYLDEIIECGSPPSFFNDSCEFDLSGDWLKMKYSVHYERRVLKEYKTAVESRYEKHKNGKHKNTSWTPLRLKDFLDSRKRGRPRDSTTDEYYQEIADRKAKGESNQEIVRWIRRSYSDRSYPNQDIQRAVKRYGLPQ